MALLQSTVSSSDIFNSELNDPQWNLKISRNGAVNDGVVEEPCDIFGEGGMATVLLVDDSSTKNGVASKTLTVNVMVVVAVLALIVVVFYIRSARECMVPEIRM